MKNYYGQGTITKKAIQAQTRENKEKNQLVDSMNNDNEVDLENWQRLLERNLMDLDRPVTLLESDIPILIDFIKQLLAQKDEEILMDLNELLMMYKNYHLSSTEIEKVISKYLKS